VEASENVVAASGVRFPHTSRRPVQGKILEDTGSGVALIDYDGRHELDVFPVERHGSEGVSGPGRSRQDFVGPQPPLPQTSAG